MYMGITCLKRNEANSFENNESMEVNMDIYRFLEASDVVKAHCREIGKTWNTYEMALIIGHSNQPRDERLLLSGHYQGVAGYARNRG